MTRRLSAGQRAVEAVANRVLVAPIIAVAVALAAAGEIAERCPSPRALWWAARNIRIRRIR